ncbi:hypothetical protein ELY40_02640 [Vreelandella populi]|uniref:Uncharacterized protein n=1 Tax=Vreelandella populi TaxID=2498858 RepID=A0A3S0WLZ9_9GAMM|nr:hypothetical protein ELY25_11415 [Halomonas populi]RUR50442.1 hypothetical protein ELY37_00145 [Halomonas populi]RUR56850.1 hypothetical protein ELY40_02640 [Halomonas populi]
MVVLKTSWWMACQATNAYAKRLALRGAGQNRYYSVTPMHSAKANAFIEQEFIYDRITDKLW